MDEISNSVAIDHHIGRIFFNKLAFDTIDHVIKMVSKSNVIKFNRTGKHEITATRETSQKCHF